MPTDPDTYSDPPEPGKRPVLADGTPDLTPRRPVDRARLSETLRRPQTAAAAPGGPTPAAAPPGRSAVPEKAGERPVTGHGPGHPAAESSTRPHPAPASSREARREPAPKPHQARPAEKGKPK